MKIEEALIRKEDFEAPRMDIILLDGGDVITASKPVLPDPENSWGEWDPRL